MCLVQQSSLDVNDTTGWADGRTHLAGVDGGGNGKSRDDSDHGKYLFEFKFYEERPRVDVDVDAVRSIHSPIPRFLGLLPVHPRVDGIFAGLPSCGLAKRETWNVMCWSKAVALRQKN
jgi:hypothetical protein